MKNKMKNKMKVTWEWLKSLFQKSPDPDVDWQDRMAAEARLYSSKRLADADLLRIKAEQKQKTMDSWELFWFKLRDMFVEMKQMLTASHIEKTEAEVKLQQAKTQKWQQMPAVINAIAKVVRVQVRLTLRAISRFFQRRFNKDHRLATFAVLAVLLVLFGFVLAMPRVWQAGLIALVVVGLLQLPKWWKALQPKFMHYKLAWKNRAKKPVSWQVSFLLALGFTVLTIFGIVTGSVWVKGFAPVGAFWSICLPILTRKSFWAICFKPAIIVPPCIWMAVWIVVRFR